jgi:hypothetical protein
MRQEERWRHKVAELQTTFASVKASLGGEERSNQQLKDEVRRLKLEANKIREAMHNESVALKQERYYRTSLLHRCRRASLKSHSYSTFRRRETFLQAIQAANSDLRTLHALNRGVPRAISAALNVPTPSSGTCSFFRFLALPI